MSLVLKDSALLRADGFIDGAWTAAASGARFAVTNPASGAELAQVADMGAAETERAIAAAERALPAWRARTTTAGAELNLLASLLGLGVTRARALKHARARTHTHTLEVNRPPA